MFSCFGNKQDQIEVHAQPIKFKILKSINVFQPLINTFLHPSKKQKYKFDRRYLHFIDFQQNDVQKVSSIHKKQTINTNQSKNQGNTLSQSKNSIPVVHFAPSFKKNEQTDIIFYCHGSGSTLNHVFNYGLNLSMRYNTAFISFDFRGQGESQGNFISYEEDFQIALSYILKLGYKFNRIIFCGYSIGTYPVLKFSTLLKIPKILISPICGLIPFIEGTLHRYQGQPYDNILYSIKSKGRTLLIHAKQQLIPLDHSRKIAQNLLTQNKQSEVQLYSIDGYNHRTIPHFLAASQAKGIMKNYIKKFRQQNKLYQSQNDEANKYKKYLEQLGKIFKIVSGKKRQ